MFSVMFQVVQAIREVGTTLDSICDMMFYCSFCNERFGTTLLKQLMVSMLVILSFITYLNMLYPSPPPNRVFEGHIGIAKSIRLSVSLSVHMSCNHNFS